MYEAEYCTRVVKVIDMYVIADKIHLLCKSHDNSKTVLKGWSVKQDIGPFCSHGVSNI